MTIDQFLVEAHIFANSTAFQFFFWMIIAFLCILSSLVWLKELGEK